MTASPEPEPLPTGGDAPAPVDWKRRTDREDVVVPAEGIAESDIDQDALRVLSRLQRNEYEAYLVGGCVRDLLLGRRPKDFDVATQAHPRQVKRLFRNGRIIGRRFRLVHVIYGDHVVETATFRREPDLQGGDDEDLLIREDNVYGTAKEDALRRDFTVNGLFFDTSTWRIHDFVGGLGDLEQGLLRTIGDPRVRFAEDPVRILRAIKFATRLGFQIEEETWDAMCELTGELVRAAPPRVLEEILRLLRSGTALGAFRMMRACGALAVLLPEVDDYLGSRTDTDPAVRDRADSYWRLLEALDAEVHAKRELSTSTLVAVAFLRVVEHKARELQAEAERDGGGHVDLYALAGEVLDPVASPARLSRRVIEEARRMIANQRRFTQPSAKGFRPLLFMRAPGFENSLDLFRLHSAAWGQGWDIYEGWVERYKRALEVPDEELAQMRHKRRRRRRR